jgi:hypothetical protein
MQPRQREPEPGLADRVDRLTDGEVVRIARQVGADRYSHIWVPELGWPLEEHGKFAAQRCRKRLRMALNGQISTLNPGWRDVLRAEGLLS